MRTGTERLQIHRPVRVLLIDDSRTMRRLITMMLSRDPRLQIVGEAACASDALELIGTAAPDVLTLDVEMPGMSGLDFLQYLMRRRPIPVVMVSSMTSAGSAAAVQAMSLGAIDCVGKPTGPVAGDVFAGLADKLVMAASANLSARTYVPDPVAARPAPPPPAAHGDWSGRVLLFGASTGGVDALERVLRRFPGDCPPTVIVQHMPDSFLVSFAARLDAAMEPQVVLARDGMTLVPGQVLLAPGGACHLHLHPGEVPVCRLVEGDRRGGYRPSVDETFESAAFLGHRAVAALLTGMGRDGADGMALLRAAGALTMAQDQPSSVVWGMPRAAWEDGAAQMLLPLDQLADTMLLLAALDPTVAGDDM